MSAGRAIWAAIVGVAVAAGCERRAVPPGPPPTASSPLRFVDSTGATVDPLRPVDGGVHCLVFVTVDCPLANNYAPEIQAIEAEYARRGVRFWLVHVDPAVDLVAARRHAVEYGHDTPLLLDSDHRLVEAVGASCTPEAAVVDAAGALAYRGRIDDWYTDYGRKKPRPTSHELRDALDAVLAGRAPEPARTEPLGCFIADFK